MYCNIIAAFACSNCYCVGMTETEEQKIAIKWLRDRFPEYDKSIRVSLSGLNFGSGARAGRMINHIKSLGVVGGESDILLALPKGGYGSLVLEHKGADQSHKVSEKQQEYLDYHTGIGNLSISTRGIDEFKSAILDYLSL